MRFSTFHLNITLPTKHYGHNIKCERPASDSDADESDVNWTISHRVAVKMDQMYTKFEASFLWLKMRYNKNGKKYHYQR